MKKLLNITFARFVTLCTLLVAPFYSFAADNLPYYCPDRKYTSCNTGYYMTFGGVYNGTPQLGNSCDECPVGCTCAGGTAAPVCAHSVSYKCDADGDIYQTDKVIYMTEYHTLAEVCEKPGYYHTMWYDSENSTNKLIPDDDLEWPYETDKTFIAEYIPNTFNVYYAGNGNTGGVAPSAPSAPTACTYDATCVAPANTYTRDGYTFTGWKCTGGDASCDGDIIQPGTSISNATTVFNGTIKMTAQWQESAYEMGYSCGSGTDVEGGLDTLKDINVIYGNEYTFANGNQECHRDGYTFAGWQTYIDGQIVTKQSGDKYTWTYAGNLLWTAKWQENTYTITYDTYGSEDVMYNGSLPDAPEIPTKRGYIFNGWWTQTSGGTQYYNASNTPVINKYTLTDDLMLYAQWTPITYTVYYNDGANIAEAQCTYGTPCVVKNSTRTGYDLTGWVCISDIMNCDEDTLIQPQTDLNTYIKEGATSGQSVDMVAVWQAKKYTCVPGKYLNGTKCLDCTPGAYCPGVKDIPYDGGIHGFEDCPDDGSSPDKAEKRTQCYIIEKCTDGGDGTRTCHYETKGYTNCTACEYNTCDKGYYKNGQTCDICPLGYSCDGTYKTICDTGTYADKQGQETCTPCPQPYTQTDSRGATSATQCYATCDVSCEPAACDIENVKSCEYESRKIGSIKYNDGQNICQVPSTANLTCAITGFTCQDGYAKNGNLCEPIEYKIKYVLDGGRNDGSNPTTYTVEHLPITLKNATRDGYTFNGWYNSATGGNRITEIKQGEIGDKTLYARWLARTIILQFETGGIGIAPTTPDNCTYDSVFDMPDAVKVNGYNFDKWSVNGKKFSANASVACTYDNLGTGDVAIISATWADPDAYTIRYYENGGTDVDDDKYTVADTVSLPITTRAGYTFAGWYNNDNFTGSAVTQINQGSTGDKTFWAKWNKCTAGKYCPGDNNEHDCPAGFPKSDPGATSDTQCYALCDVACTQPACDIKNVQSCEYESRKIDGIKYNDGQNICQLPSDANLTCAITGFTCQDGYAKNGNLCEPIEYKIKYVLDGGTNDGSNPTTYTVEHLPITLQDATRIGYTFAGWTDDNGNTVSTIATGTTGNITLTAQWDDCGVGNWCANGVKTSCTEYGANYTTDSANAKSADECYQPCTVACIEPECPSGMNCDYETKSTDGKQYWNSNTCDAVPSVCDFIVSCKPAFEMIAGQCEPCMREHALSYKDTGNCLVETCEDGYYPDGTECRNAVIDCTDIKPNATHATQTWLNTGFGRCVVHECDSGYHIEDNNCVADEMPCDLDNGTGLKTWNPVTRAWNTCTVVECMPGYTSDPTLTNENWKQCGRCNNMYADNGALVASSYTHECEIASCFYQGERYILEDNECRLICDEYSDETGHRYWDDKRKKCVHDCNIGYNPW